MEPVRRGFDLTNRRVLRAGWCIFLLGLTACGNPSPEAPRSGPAMGLAGAGLSSTVGGPAGAGTNDPASPTLTPSSPLGPTARDTSQSGTHSPDASRVPNAAPNTHARTAASTADIQSPDEKMKTDQAQRAARQSWYAAVREHPDVTVRLQALELWAQQPGDALDPVTYALVDGDESVRARAQELYEQQLTRAAAVP